MSTRYRHVLPWRRRCQGWGSVQSSTLTPRDRRETFTHTPARLSFEPELIQQDVPQWWQSFDPNLDMKFGTHGLYHIVVENEKRLREICEREGVTYNDSSENECDPRLRDAVSGAIELARKKASRQPRVVIPALYLPGGLKKNNNWCFQLLLPIYLSKGDDAPNCALSLVLHQAPDRRWSYTASTILTIDMAYRNARMLNSVESAWAQAAMNKILRELRDRVHRLELERTATEVSGAEESASEVGEEEAMG